MGYDYLVVGAGLSGAVFARRAREAGPKVLVIDKRPHIGGSIRTETLAGITVHRYGAHIFHTDNAAVWQFVSRFARLVPYCHEPKANYRGRLYSLPFTMHTFREMWGDVTPAEAAAIIASQRNENAAREPANLEEQAVALVGRDIYEKLVRGYTEKQWGRPCRELPAFLIRRLPVRFNDVRGYFDDRFQGIPAEGYTAMTAAMLEGCEIRTSEDYLADRGFYGRLAERIFYTGPLDAFYRCDLGALAYRTLRFEHKVLDVTDHQGCAVVNYTGTEVPWTRIIEHRHFLPEAYTAVPRTVVTYEYSEGMTPGAEPCYPVNDPVNEALAEAYRRRAGNEKRVIMGGRLGTYRYLDMDDAAALSLGIADRLFR